MKKIILFLLILFLPSILLADIKKIKVVDGDTIHIDNVKYRLFGRQTGIQSSELA